MGYQTNLSGELRKAGVSVVEVGGWQTRGSASFAPRGGVAHHTAAPQGSNAPSLRICTYGRSDLPGPLCNVLLARDGTAFVVAAGRANHAGSGGYRGLSGNSSVWGIEAENNGVGEPWSQKQLIAYYQIAAVMANISGFGADMWCGHKEWTSRKIDPNGIDMNDFRAKVDAYMGGGNMPLNDDDIDAIGWKLLEQFNKLIKPQFEEAEEREFKTRRIIADIADSIADADKSKWSAETKAYVDQINEKYK